MILRWPDTETSASESRPLATASRLLDGIGRNRDGLGDGEIPSQRTALELGQ